MTVCDVAQNSSVPTTNEGILRKFRNFSAIYGLDYIINRYLWRRRHEATAQHLASN